MKRPWLIILAVTLLGGCDNPQTTVDQLRQEIAAYRTYPSALAQQKIEVDFTKLEAQIEKLETKGQTSEASGYRTTSENLRADYRAARMVDAMNNAQSAIKGLGNAFKEAGQSISDTFREKATPTPNTP